MDDDVQLREALNQLSDADDIQNTEEVEERARVRKARASVTERARQTGDSVGNLLSGLIDDSNAEMEAERTAKMRKAQEAEERAKAKREAEEAKKREAAEQKIQEEKRRQEEKEQRRLQMIADMEKQRKLEAGEVDEEEEARKRQEAEAKAAREAAEKAREAAEEAQLQSSNQELADQIRAIKLQKAQEEQIAAEKKRKQDLLIKSAIAAAAVLLIIGLSYYFATKKAPDFYTLRENYETRSLTMTNNIPTAESVAMKIQPVSQSAPQKAVSKGGKKGPKTQKDNPLHGANVFDTNKIVK